MPAFSDMQKVFEMSDRASAAKKTAPQANAVSTSMQPVARGGRKPNVRAIQSNLKRLGVDAVRNNLAAAYGGTAQAEDLIKQTTGFASTDPALQAAIKNYRSISSNPVTGPVAYRPNPGWADKAAAYEARQHRAKILSNADKYPDSAGIFLGGDALQPATRGLDPDNPIDAAYTSKVRPRVKMIGSDDAEKDPWTGTYTPNAVNAQKARGVRWDEDTKRFETYVPPKDVKLAPSPRLSAAKNNMNPWTASTILNNLGLLGTSKLPVREDHPSFVGPSRFVGPLYVPEDSEQDSVGPPRVGPLNLLREDEPDFVGPLRFVGPPKPRRARKTGFGDVRKAEGSVIDYFLNNAMRQGPSPSVGWMLGRG